MRSQAALLCLLLAVGCGKPGAIPEEKGPTSQFAAVEAVPGPAPDPAHPDQRSWTLQCTVALIPAYKYKDPAELTLWVFPRSSASGLNDAANLADPALHGRRAPILGQSFTAEGALLNFEAGWPGGPMNQILALDVSRRGRKIGRMFWTMAGR